MIRSKLPDKAKARSLITAAESDMQFIVTLPISHASAQTIIRGIYENFRMLGEALLTARGYTELDDLHRQMISELIQLKIATSRSLQLLGELRKMRHRINYDGYIPTEAELNYVVDIKKALWKPVLSTVKEQIEK